MTLTTSAVQLRKKQVSLAKSVSIPAEAVISTTILPTVSLRNSIGLKL